MLSLQKIQVLNRNFKSIARVARNIKSKTTKKITFKKTKKLEKKCFLLEQSI